MNDQDFVNQISFNEAGLVPAIVQDVTSNEVLMMAWMNRESLTKTIQDKRTWFYSRSRNELWAKGDTSGATQEVKELFYDCDGDTLLVQVVQNGSGACHTGNYSCFYRKLSN